MATDATAAKENGEANQPDAVANARPSPLYYDKQKDLLSSDTGHFSLIRALHLADLITELNGEVLKETGRPISACSTPRTAWHKEPVSGYCHTKVGSARATSHG
jgi:hypothetical protein